MSAAGTDQLATKQVGRWGSPGLVVMGDDSWSKGRGLESWHHILDGIDIFYIDLLYKLYGCLFEKTENKRKRGRGWPIFKKNK